MRVCLIGPGDTKFHFSEVVPLSEDAIKNHISGIAQALVDTKSEIVFLPDKGISFDVVKKFKGLGGKKVFGSVPTKDKDFGINHLSPYLNEIINGKKLVDEIIDTDNWYKQDLLMPTFGDVILVLGYSPGSVREFSTAYYMYKLFGGHKKEVQVKKKQIHPSIIAGDTVPFDTIVYMPFCQEKPSPQIEKYIRALGCKVHYATSIWDLKDILFSLQKK